MTDNKEFLNWLADRSVIEIGPAIAHSECFYSEKRRYNL